MPFILYLEPSRVIGSHCNTKSTTSGTSKNSTSNDLPATSPDETQVQVPVPLPVSLLPDQQDEEEGEKNDKNNVNTSTTKKKTAKAKRPLLSSSQIQKQVQLDENAIREEWEAKDRRSRGDLRMHRAVTARLANPELSLFQALIIGGFEFPGYKEEKIQRRDGKNTSAQVQDSDNILLRQRKNQLNRRLRFHCRKKRAEEARRRNQEAMRCERDEG